MDKIRKQKILKHIDRLYSQVMNESFELAESEIKIINTMVQNR